MTPVMIPRAVFMRPLLHTPIDPNSTEIVSDLRKELFIPGVTSNLQVELGGEIVILRSASQRPAHRAPRLFLGSMSHAIDRFLELTPQFADDILSIIYGIDYQDDAGALKTLNLHTNLATVDMNHFEISLHEAGLKHHVFFDQEMTQRLMERGIHNLLGFHNTWLRVSEGYA